MVEVILEFMGDYTCLERVKIMSEPVAKLIGQNGNIFNLMAIASNSLKNNGMHDKAEEMRERIMGGEAESYDAALRIIMEYVEVE